MRASITAILVLFSLTGTAPAQSGAEPAIPLGASSAETPSGIRAGFWWADYDRDGFEDAFAVGAEGTAKLLRNSGDGSFLDVTLISGLDGLGAAKFAAWQDFDRDGAPDLFVGTPSGAGHLMRNAGDGTFQDVTQFVGLSHSGNHVAAQWLDYDLDGWVDLAVRTEDGEHLYHALPSGHFEAVDLRIAAQVSAAAIGALGVDEADGSSSDDASSKSDSRAPTASRRRKPASALPFQPTPGLVPSGPNWSLPGGSLNLITCVDAIKNQATSTCISASSTPTMGWLYPLTINLNVSAAGNVGIGTTTPSFKLDVAGTARMSDTLTLNPAGDQALNVSTGSIYKNGVLFAHTKGGSFNTALGKNALTSVTSGSFNTASGEQALFSNTIGYSNTASGYRASFSNTTGSRNTASGDAALFANTTGSGNTASGNRALFSNTTGIYNTACGNAALYSNTTGDRNAACGNAALLSNTTGGSNTASGSHALFSNTTGSRNTAVAMNALRSNTTANDNTAVGYKALFANSVGTRNTAVAVSALSSNTTANDNTAVGFSALVNNTAGYDNTASGSYALAGNTTGIRNTAFGKDALRSNTLGTYNTAAGYAALKINTFGVFNTAVGAFTLAHNTIGSSNTGTGDRALEFNTSGSCNTAVGELALESTSTGGHNTAVGWEALANVVSGRDNVALGYAAGRNWSNGASYNIAIGNRGVLGDNNTLRVGMVGQQTRAFITGIRGVTTDNADAIPVVIDSAGQLGTVSSSRRFKKDIADMGDTSRLLKLRPVKFRYKQEQKLPDGSQPPMEYGLIAEEVAEILPDLVVYDEEGKPFTVKYHILSSMLLNELERLDAKDRERSAELAELRSRLDALESRADATAEKARTASELDESRVKR